MAAGRLGYAYLGCFILIVTLLKSAWADTYTVGDELGWTIPPAGSIAYSTWSRTKNFDIGDIIVFNWTGMHDVSEVSEADYNSCTKTDPVGSIQENSPANFTLISNTTRYFICTVSNHCELGQKVTIRIGERSSASSLRISTFSALLSAMLVSFFIYT